MHGAVRGPLPQALRLRATQTSSIASTLRANAWALTRPQAVGGPFGAPGGFLLARRDHSNVSAHPRDTGRSRKAIRRYLRGAEPAGQPRGVVGAPVRDAVRPRAEALLEESKRCTAGKQRLTAARLHELLRGEGYGVAYTAVKLVVREWKRQRREVFAPLVYRPGDLGQVDFFEVFVDIAGERRKADMFVTAPDALGPRVRQSQGGG